MYFLYTIFYMKLSLLTHNIRVLTIHKILKRIDGLNSLTSKPYIMMIYDHKLRGRLLEILGTRLLLGCANWILEAMPRERSWLKLNATRKGGVEILLDNKLAKLVTIHGSLFDYIVFLPLRFILDNLVLTQESFH